MSTRSWEKKRAPPRTAVPTSWAHWYGFLGERTSATSSPLARPHGMRMRRMTASIQKRTAKAPRSFLACERLGYGGERGSGG